MFFELNKMAQGKFSDQAALIEDNGKVISYGDLADAVSEFGSHKLKRSLAFCLCQNSIGSVIGYLGFLNHRVVPLLLDRKIERDLLDRLLQIYRPEYLYVPDEMSADFPEYEQSERKEGYCLMRAVEAKTPTLYEELALLLTTSGSTGSPKLVRQSYTNIQSNAETIAQYLELDRTERPITTLPMSYTYGLSIINSHLQVGATILLTNYTIIMKSFWDFFGASEATSFGGVPYTYEMLKRVKFFRMQLPGLRYMTQAGGKLSPELHKEFAEWSRERNTRFIVMYGQTEATARMAYLPAKDSLDKYGSVGIAIPGGAFSLIDTDGGVIEKPDQVGELVYRGPNVTLGYAECREDLSKGDERAGVLVTGDMAKRDEDGYYYIVGRKKRFLKVFGNRVNLDEIDRMIKAHFTGLECASTGVDDHVKIYITDQEKPEEVKQWISRTTHLSETAFSVAYIPRIPQNEAGKIMYNELEKGEN